MDFTQAVLQRAYESRVFSRDIQEPARQHVLAQGLSLNKNPAWRYTSLRRWDWTLTSQDPGIVTRIGLDVPKISGFAQVLCIDGAWTFPIDRSLRAMPLSTAYELGLLSDIESLKDADGFSALNLALLADGLFLDISGESFIHLHYTDRGLIDNAIYSPRVHIRCRSKSRLTLVETWQSHRTSRSFLNACTSLELDDEANVVALSAYTHGPDHPILHQIQAKVGSNAAFRASQHLLSGPWNRCQVDVQLTGRGAKADLSGLTVVSGTQQGDHTISIKHLAPETTSRQTFKALAGGQGRSVFSGHIKVAENGIGTDARQLSRGLLLGKQAEIMTQPQLEICTDELSCSHGATVADLEEEEIFYLQSRGLSKSVARQLLCLGFANEPLSDLLEIGCPGAQFVHERQQSVIHDLVEMADEVEG